MHDFEQNFWNDFYKIHNMTKEMYIKSEEYDDDFCSLMQPIKEQRDALDHIVRSYQAIISNKNEHFDKEYIRKNFDKALGHMYRAFYDTADILSISLREQISKTLNNYSYREIISCWEDYEDIRIELVNMPKRIAKLRLKKEIKSNRDEQEKIFEEYHSVLEFLFNTLDYINLDFFPRVNKIKQ